MPKRKVLIAGASGLIGHAGIAHFAGLPDWEVVGISRRVPDDLPGAELISVDLMDTARCEEVFSKMDDVTEVVYAALQEQPGLFAGWLDEELIEKNGQMCRNLFEPILRVAKNLEHVSLLHGTKAYGGHHPSLQGVPVHIPLREREPRREHRNFYFVQEDYLREKQKGASWGLTTFRPTVVYGDAGGNNMNPIPAIAAYAAILKERGEPLHFPGREGLQGLREAVDADLIARALEWSADTKASWGNAYNLTNGDVFTWPFVWPAIAKVFEMEPGEDRPISLVEEMPKMQDEWAAIVDKYNLKSSKDLVEFAGYNSIVYSDMVLAGGARGPVPALNSTIAARLDGFHDCIDTEDMFVKLFTKMRRDRWVP